MNSVTSHDSTAKTFLDISNLSKKYGSKTVLRDINLQIGEGEIVGLIGPNGAGKSTLLKAIMGLIKYSGECAVFGQEPYKNRTKLLEKMSYVADVAVLPTWMKVKDLLDFVKQTHPGFSKNRALELLADSPIVLKDEIGALSKGMKTRLHLAIILSIEADFLVLDEPTLGLDVMVRRDFQDRLVEEYYNKQRSILITTHQVDEIESILTRVVFIREGQISLDLQLTDLKTRYIKLLTSGNIVFSDPEVKPIYQRALPAHTELIFEGVEADQLKQYGEVVVPTLEDLFVATNT